MITISRATTEAEREAVYRFRYSVYVEEMGRYRASADHTGGRLVDPEDDHSWNFYAHDGTEVVASYRTTWGHDGFSDRQIEQYGLAPFLAELPARALLVGERTMVAPAYRGTSVGVDLANGGQLPGCDDVCVVFGACEPHLISYYARLGTVPYASRNITSAQSGYLIPLVSFPMGLEATCGIGVTAGVPPCVQRAIHGDCAATNPLTVGDAYWDRLEADLEDLGSRPTWSLAGLTCDEVRRCTERSSIIDCADGDQVVKRGGSAHNMFLVLAGRLEVHDESAAVGRLEAGDLFGEAGFLLQEPRSFDIVAAEDGTRILCLSERVLRQVIVEEPIIAAKLLTNISQVLCRRHALAT